MPSTARRARIAFVAGVVALAVVALGALIFRGGGDEGGVPVKPSYVPTPPGTKLPPLRDPFSYEPAERADFERRAAAGNAHILYARSPGGAFATAERVARWRPQVDAAAKKARLDPDMLEALVFLESAGRPDAVTRAGIEGAAGLTQIVAQTATGLLGMHVDVARSRALSRRIARAEARGAKRRLHTLLAERRRADERFDPVKALAATGRYLDMALVKFRSQELAFVSYHMGMGNLEGVLSSYAGGPTEQPLPWAQVYFDTSPTRHPETYRRLFLDLHDDSSNYLWKLLAARDIMGLYRSDPQGLRATQALQTAKASAEELLHPPATTPVYADPAALRRAFDDGQLVTFPSDPARTGLRLDRRMGELAPRLGRTPELYRGLRPEALAMALYIGARVREFSGNPSSALTITSTVRDRRYQELMTRDNVEATPNFSLHTTGWAFDVLRRYQSRGQALAFQFVLDRLTSLNLIAWVREPAAIHVTAAEDAAALKPLLERLR